MATDLFASGGVPDGAAPTAGADLFADTTKPAPFKQGFGAGVQGTKSGFYGAGALVAHAVGADKAEAIALERSQQAADAAAAQTSKIEDVDWTSPASIVNHIKFLAGNALPSLATMAVGGAAARGFGAAAGLGTKALNAATLTGAVVPDVALEAGGIYPEALKTGVENPATRAAVGGAAAASLDFVPLLAAEKYLGAAGKGGIKALAKGAAKGAPVGAVLEGGQETLQSVVERAAAGQSLTDAEAQSDYLNSFAGGAVPGAGFGAVIGGAHGRAAPAIPDSRIANESANEPAPAAPTAPANAVGTPSAAAETSAIPQAPLALVPTEPNELGLVPKTTPLEDAWTAHNALEAQHDELTKQVSSLEASVKKLEGATPSKDRPKRQLVLEQRAANEALMSKKAELIDASTRLVEAKAAIKTQEVLAGTPTGLNPDIAVSRAVTPDSNVIETKPPVSDTTAAETAVAQVKQNLGMLVSSREAKLAPVQTPREQALEVVKSRDRETVRKQGAKTAAQTAANEHLAPLLDSAKIEGAVRERIMNRVDGIVAEAAQKPSTKEAQQHLATELTSLLKRRVPSVDAAELASTMINAVGAAQTLYSKGAMSQTSIPRDLKKRGEQVVSHTDAERRLAAGERIFGFHDLDEAPSAIINVGDLAGWEPDQLLAYPSTHNSKGAVRKKNFKNLTTEQAEKLTTAELDQAIEYFTNTASLDARGTGYKTDADFILNYLEELRGTQNSTAALTTEQFVALPLAAQHAAVDFYDSAMQQRGQQLIARIRDMIGEDEGLTVQTFQASPGSPIGGYTRLGQMKSIISMALNAKDALSIADHEGFHYAEDRILNARERQVVRDALRPGSRMFKLLLEKVQAYDRENKTRLADEITSTPAEARAYAFEYWKRGELQPEGALARAFEKIKQFFDKVANYVKGVGFTSIEDIFTALDRGQFAEREKNDSGGIGTLLSVAATDGAEASATEQASVADLVRRFRNGELEREQMFLQVAKMLDSADSQIVAPKTLAKAYGKEAAGVFTRARTYLATGTHISRFSTGYKNVLKALSAQEDYKNRLIEDGSKVGLSTWQDASQADRDVVFDALLERRVKGYVEGSKEMLDLRARLAESPAQIAMFDQVSGKDGTIAKFLNLELGAESADFKRLMPADEFATWEKNRTASVQGLIDSGYVPERRYGDHTVRLLVDVPNPDGTVSSHAIAREHFENPLAAAKRFQQYEQEIKAAGADIRVEQGIRHKAERDSEVSIQQVLDVTRRQGIQLTQVEKEKLARALIAADSIRRNRMMRATHTPGYSRDGWRVLNEFVVGMSARVSHSTFSSTVNDALDGRPVEARVDENGAPVTKTDAGRDMWAEDGPMSGFYRNLANERADMVLSPIDGSEISTKLKTAAMTYFIGGSIGSGVVQMVSVPMNTLPYLSQHTEYANAFSTTMAAWGYTLKNASALRDLNKLKDPDVVISGMDANLRQGLITGSLDGTLTSTEIHQIMGISRGGVLAQSRKVQKALDLWMAPFKYGESTSRIASFISAWKIGEKNGLSDRDLYDFARKAVDETQNRFDPVHRPAIAAHPIGSLLFMFKSFPLFMVEMIEAMYKQNPKSAAYMLLGLVAMTGVQGLPFAEDLLDLIDVVSQKLFNSPFQMRRAMRNMIKDASEAMVGVDMSNLVLRGAVNDIIGLNVATRAGMGDLVPGTRMGAADMDYSRAMEQLLGAPISMVVAAGGQIGKLGGGILKGDMDQMLAALRAGGPVAVRNAIKGYEQLDKGFAEDARGNKIIDASVASSLWQMAGISSGALTKMYDNDSLDKQRNSFYIQAGRDMRDALTRAIRDGDTDKAQEIHDAMTKWDEANPEMPLRLNPAAMRRQIMLSGVPLNQRTLMTMPKQLRGTSTAAEGISQ